MPARRVASGDESLALRLRWLQQTGCREASPQGQQIAFHRAKDLNPRQRDCVLRILGAAIAGDATLFARQDVVEAAWAIVDPVIHGPSPMYDYDPGTWGPVEADALVEQVGGWNTPE